MLYVEYGFAIFLSGESRWLWDRCNDGTIILP